MTTTVWRGKMSQRADGLWVRAASDEIANEVKARRFKRGLRWGKRKRTIYDHAGNPIGGITVDDAGNSHHEYSDHQDAVARPDPVSITAAAQDATGAAPEDLIESLLLDCIPLDEANRNYDLARAKLDEDPEDPEAQAGWRRAKDDLFASRQLSRLQKGRG